MSGSGIMCVDVYEEARIPWAGRGSYSLDYIERERQVYKSILWPHVTRSLRHLRRILHVMGFTKHLSLIA